MIVTTAKWQYELIYLDETDESSKNVGGHMDHLRKILTLLVTVGLTLKLRKCKFFADKMDYLGNFIRTGRLKIPSHIADDISGLTEPTTITHLKSF